MSRKKPAAVTEAPQAVEAAEEVTAAAPAAPAAPTAIRISAKRPQGIWRAGRFWPPEPVSVTRADFTPDQWDRLEAEPVLSITGD